MVNRKRSKSTIPPIKWESMEFFLVTPDEIEKWLREYGKEILYEPDDKGYEPLHWACQLGLAGIAACLLKNGALVDSPARLECKSQPMHIASMQGFPEVIDVLISYGADVNARDEYKCTPLMRAVMTGNHQVRKSKTILHLMCRGADPYLTDFDKRSVLHYAVIKEDIESVSLLINIGLDPNVHSQTGLTPLHLAYHTGNYQLVKQLMLVTSKKDHLHTKIKANKSLKSMFSDLIRYGSKLFVAFAFTTTLLLVYPIYVYELMPKTLNFMSMHVAMITFNALIWILWYATWSTDPGYIPKNAPEYNKILTQKTGSADILKDEMKAIEEGGRKIKKEGLKLPEIPHHDVKLCHTCAIVQVEGTKHCRYCNRCVANHYHHCIYLNTCISSANRIYFLGLTISLLVTGVSLFVLLFVHLKHSNFVPNAVHFTLFLFALKLISSGGFMSILIFWKYLRPGSSIPIELKKRLKDRKRRKKYEHYKLSEV